MSQSKSTNRKSQIANRKNLSASAVARKASNKNKKNAITKTQRKTEAWGLKLSVYNMAGKSVETLILPKEIFGANINTNLMTQAVRVYLANQRRGTVKTKSRGEVNISTRKIYRQKGTGRARHGAASAPIFVGGGLAFGPRQRDYSLKLSKKMKRLALISSLSAKVKEGQIKLVSGLSKIEPKTKTMAQVLEKLDLILEKLDLGGKNLPAGKAGANLLLVTPNQSKDFFNIIKAARNIKGVTIMPANLLNTYEVLKNKNLLLMKECMDTFKEGLKEN